MNVFSQGMQCQETKINPFSEYLATKVGTENKQSKYNSPLSLPVLFTNLPLPESAIIKKEAKHASEKNTHTHARTRALHPPRVHVCND